MPLREALSCGPVPEVPVDNLLLAQLTAVGIGWRMTNNNDTSFPSAETRFPLQLPDGSCHAGTVFLKAVLSHSRIEVGEYSYASSFDPPDNWASRLAPHLYDCSPEKLVIGKFCQIAHGVVFIT